MTQHPLDLQVLVGALLAAADGGDVDLAGIEFVVGYLVAWVVRKVRRVGEARGCRD